ncbi:MAG: hypothetical protein OXI39_10085 [Gemmatimonadota bacterium]|uniref:hypothetical protein n=1 Tax=Candidatus Palauibacter scopulicola TaxID=3056741 RepID=UPI002386F638|nr:hypothetical protein [Candidatus Palauibacter scopulicola]MDE2663335.1 hypothetical protein [Candidatus Palauibacter scopulicola]
MNERPWIRVDQGKYDEPREIGMSASADVELDVFISPFDIPKAVRGYYERKRERFVIDFKYITDEPRKYENFGPAEVTAVVGKKTGRILGFEIDVKAIGAESVALRVHAANQVHEAIEAARKVASRRPITPNDPWGQVRVNSYVADRILQDFRDEVFAGEVFTGT